MSTRHPNNLPVVLAAIVMIAACTWRFPWPSGDFRLVMTVFFETAVYALLMAWIWSKNKWVAMFLGLSVASLFYQYPLADGGTTTYTKQNYYALQAVLFGCLWFSLLTQFLTKGNVHHLLNGMCVIALTVLAYLILEVFDVGIKPRAIGSDLVGIVGNRNLTSALLLFCLPAFFRKRWVWCAIPVIIGIIALKTSLTFIATLMVICFFVCSRKYYKRSLL